VKGRDQDFGKVGVGDYVIQYCINDVESNPGQIRNIYEVVAPEKIDDDVDKALKKGTIDKEEADQLKKQPHIIRLRLHSALKKGHELSLIRKWVEDNMLYESNETKTSEKQLGQIFKSLKSPACQSSQGV
jgi:hypothetical protein